MSVYPLSRPRIEGWIIDVQEQRNVSCEDEGFVGFFRMVVQPRIRRFEVVKESSISRMIRGDLCCEKFQMFDL